MTSVFRVCLTLSVTFQLPDSNLAKDLITHLLCVDPVQRYTIDEFLAHPWCNAAPAPPPPPTPYMYPHLTIEKRPLDSPLLRGQLGQAQAYDGRSPGIQALKEAFDVTYAVHRMEEEGRRRGGRRNLGPTGFLAGLNEDDENEDEVEDLMIEVPDLPQQDRTMEGRAGLGDHGKGQVVRASEVGAGYPAAGPAANLSPLRERERQHHRSGRRAFELQMDNATLLGRRQNAQRDHALEEVL